MKNRIRDCPQDAQAEIWSLDMAHPLWGISHSRVGNCFGMASVLEGEGGDMLHQLGMARTRTYSSSLHWCLMFLS
uniref:Uncharacterized protein n=1 Tax=Romanomermis culicivorax TaxID=13658 RepID=A0A915JE32_ROMCU